MINSNPLFPFKEGFCSQVSVAYMYMWYFEHLRTVPTYKEVFLCGI